MEVRELGGNRSFLEWSSVFQANGVSDSEAKQIIEGSYDAGFQGLKELQES